MRNSEFGIIGTTLHYKNKNNLIPHYGTPISEYSEAVAKNVASRKDTDNIMLI